MTAKRGRRSVGDLLIVVPVTVKRPAVFLVTRVPATGDRLIGYSGLQCPEDVVIGRQQHHRVDVEAHSDSLDVVDRDVAHLPFDMGNKGSVQPSLKGQRFLRHTALTSQQQDIGRQQIADYPRLC